MTGRELISRVRSMNKLINADNSITDRAVYAELKAKASLLIKRETALRKLWQSANIFTTISCIEMEQVPLGECCDYKSPCMIRKSVKEIPKVAEGLFGLLIQGVFNVGNSEVYDYSTPNRYANILKLDLKGIKRFYWISNKHLYVTNPDVEYVNLVAYFDDDINPNDLNACLTDEQKAEKCSNLNPLDRDFKIPSYLEENLVALVNDTLNKTYFRRDEDVTDNNKDDQNPNKR